MINKLCNNQIIKFIIVGIANTVLSAIIMFFLYNFAKFGYWGSTSVSYVIGSILSFILNKNFTFNNKGSIRKTLLKFIINVTICYLLAYSIAEPFISLLLNGLSMSKSVTDQISMLFGMILYTGLNYFGQKYFAFK
ncbi:hypothetical protein SDC9_41318 [bioreactor metagenome]|uniref:GtrA/DPMS transmembrane domain-containing protein n=1 Tax=bioreactor metagenome TaxID=1076179 RepID=A0A644VXD8_9ZZZZ